VVFDIVQRRKYQRVQSERRLIQCKQADGEREGILGTTTVVCYIYIYIYICVRVLVLVRCTLCCVLYAAGCGLRVCAVYVCVK
jgi:hypothetical protein